MKRTKKIFLASLATTFLYLPGHTFAADVEIKGSTGNAVTSSASDWENGIVYGGGSETETESVRNKNVKINSGSYTGIFGGITSTGNASYNSVTFNSGNVSKQKYKYWRNEYE